MYQDKEIIRVTSLKKMLTSLKNIKRIYFIENTLIIPIPIRTTNHCDIKNDSKMIIKSHFSIIFRFILMSF